MSPWFEAQLAALLGWLALPQFGLSTVFVVAFLSATLLPMGSEPAVFGLVKLDPSLFWPAVLVATVGNTLGGAVSLLSWLPLVGDPLCALAGWLKMPFWPCVLYMAIGKFARYVTMTAALLWIFPGVFER
jgi:membrane protein YqaA with SNARE-associated domain